MTPSPSSPPRSAAHGQFLAAVLIVLAALAAYSNSFTAPFIFDDAGSILNNPTVRQLWPIWKPLSPPTGAGTVAGRPMVNLSLAVNYAISGTQVWSYHALNLLIHILGGLTLFGVLRRTMEKVGTGGPPVRDRPETQTERTDGWATRPYLLAFAAALLWTVHPLQTESVTYTVQRAESLMGLFYLLTLYCFIRYASAPPASAAASAHPEAGSGLWAVLSIFSCLLGMATKEVMASAPIMLLLYDWLFVSGTFREAWRRHGGVHAACAATWILLGYYVISNSGRGDSVGFGLGISWWAYLLTQFPAVVHYLWLSVWPHPLVFDYGAEWVAHPWSAVPDIALVLALAAASLVALWRRSPFGYLGAWFFAILGPTCLAPSNRQTLAEHRMYLALAAVAVAGVLGLHACRFTRRASPVLFVLAALVFATLTFRRNQVYHTPLALWSDTVAKRPENPRAQENLGGALLDAGRIDEAVPHYEQAIRINPTQTQAHFNFANLLARLGRTREAIAEYETTLRLEPNLLGARINLGLVLNHAHRATEAIEQFQAALRLDPDSAAAHDDLGDAFLASGRVKEAMGQFQQAAQLQPDFAPALNHLGTLLLQAGQNQAAIEYLGRAVRVSPTDADAHYNLAIALVQTGHLSEAIGHFEEAVRLKPGDADAQVGLAFALAQVGRITDAIAHCRTALQIDAQSAAARELLANLLAPGHPASARQ
jgi:tetratricopeptide (TPR) repeat protein